MPFLRSFSRLFDRPVNLALSPPPQVQPSRDLLTNVVSPSCAPYTETPCDATPFPFLSPSPSFFVYHTLDFALSMYLSIYLSIYLFIYLSIYLSLSTYVYPLLFLPPFSLLPLSLLLAVDLSVSGALLFLSFSFSLSPSLSLSFSICLSPSPSLSLSLSLYRESIDIFIGFSLSNYFFPFLSIILCLVSLRFGSFVRLFVCSFVR